MGVQKEGSLWEHVEFPSNCLEFHSKMKSKVVKNKSEHRG